MKTEPDEPGKFFLQLRTAPSLSFELTCPTSDGERGIRFRMQLSKIAAESLGLALLAQVNGTASPGGLLRLIEHARLSQQLAQFRNLTRWRVKNCAEFVPFFR